MMKTSFLKRKPLAFTLALLLALALITTIAGCANKTGGSDNAPPSVTNSPVAVDSTPVPDSRGDLTADSSELGALTPDNSGRGDLIPDNSGSEDSGSGNMPEWETLYLGNEFFLTITDVSDKGFWFEFGLPGMGGVASYAGTANFYPENDRMAEFNGLWFYLEDDSNIVVSASINSELGHLRDDYTNVRTMSDAYEDQVPWWGMYINDEFSIEITQVGYKDFWFEITLLRNGQTVLEGPAYLYPDNDHMAEFGAISFYLYDDCNAIDFFASESSEWAHLRGHYVEID